MSAPTTEGVLVIGKRLTLLSGCTLVNQAREAPAPPRVVRGDYDADCPWVLVAAPGRITLPAPGARAAITVTLAAGCAHCTVAPPDGSALDGQAAPLLLAAPQESYTFRSDGAEWFAVAHCAPPQLQRVSCAGALGDIEALLNFAAEYGWTASEPSQVRANRYTAVFAARRAAASAALSDLTQLANIYESVDPQFRARLLQFALA